ncbi:Phosphatidylglycerol/phosphatidylinositol transfer protein [Massospora cicadina]|nr:Phosphatidylglycerol/phosphatidylinositol transfer protein [Massospora cicadina]
MKFNLFVLLLFVVGQIFAKSKCRPLANRVVSNCGNRNDAFYLKNVQLLGKPVKGKRLKVRVQGALRERITKGAKVVIKVNYNGYNLLTLNKDLCDFLVKLKSGYKCSISPRRINKVQTLSIPSYAPSGRYNIVAYGYGKNNRRIFK